MHRACFTMTVATRHLATYERMHREAWPELLVALDATGWRNYSLFLHPGGRVVGYVESDDWLRSQREMSAQPVSARWSAEMDALVEPASPLHWLTLVDAGGPVRPLPARADRRVAVSESGPFEPIADPTVRWADFTGSVSLRYSEAAASHPLNRARTPFRRVFDLERQVAQLEVGRAAN